MCQKIGNTRGGMFVVEMTPVEWNNMQRKGNSEAQPNQIQRVIGADLGWLNNRTSLTMVDFSTGQPMLMDTFQAQAASGDNDTWFAQLGEVVDQVDQWLQEALVDGIPTGFAFEAVYLDKNTQTTIALATLGGLLAGVARARGCPVARVYPVQVKTALTGSSSATKAAMKKAVSTLFNRKVDEHTADSIGIALHGEAMFRQYNFTESGEVISA